MDWNQNITKRLDKIKTVWQCVQPDETTSWLRVPIDCTFLPDNHFVIADSERHSLMLYDLEDLDNYGTIRPPREIVRTEIWPNGVAALHNGNIVVTDRKENTVVMIDVETGKCVMKWKKRHMQTPCGVAVTRSGHVVVTDIGAHTMNIFSPEGHPLARGGRFGSNIEELHLPFYCTVDRKKDNIIVSDNLNFALKIYDSEGRFLQCIGSGGEWGRRQFQCPYGVTVDLEGNILAADNENDKVFMFNREGKFTEHLLVRAHCYKPSGISMSPTGHLLVTESAHDHADVKMFKIYDTSSIPTTPIWQKRTVPYKSTYI